MESNDIIAPFVLKTYQMVNDPSLDGYIHWGAANNSFIVVQPLDFSQHLLPAYFKHTNFSSFVRQLNSYGFRKVDPDRWEFASEWFLRGQTHLLKNIGRKKQIHNRNNMQGEDVEDDDVAAMSMEIARLKKEQKTFEQELSEMNKRLEAMERRPEQMMALLQKVAEESEILPRMMLKNDQRSKRLVDKKCQRILIPPSSPSLSSTWKEGDECRVVDGGWTASSPEGYSFWQSPPSLPQDLPTTTWNEIKRYTDGSGGGCDIDYSGGFSPEPHGRPPPNYPISVLGGGF